MQPALVREGGDADIRRADVVRHVGQFIDEVRQLAQASEIEAEVDAHLELEIRHHGDQVAVPHALAVAIDRALHLAGSGAHGCEGIRHADTAVVVSVDADRLAEMGDDFRCDLADELRQCTAVRLAQHDEIRACILRGLHGLERVLRVFLEAVEEVLRIVEHLAAMLLR